MLRVSNRWRMGTLAALAIGLVALGALVAFKRYRVYTKQINNYIRLSAIATGIRTVRDNSGSFPETIPPYPDMWGHEVLYLHNERHFVLVAFGRDGRRPNADYSSLLAASPTTSPIANCFDPLLETVLVDSMPWQACGK